jgi:hypothetical protein
MDENEITQILWDNISDDAHGWLWHIPDAVHAIAERMKAGVVWETHKARMTTHKDGHKMVTIDREENISITRLCGRPLSEEDGECIRVTLTREKGDGQDNNS